MWYILIILAALLAGFLFLYLRTKNTLSQKEEELRSMEQQKSELDQQTESLMEIMKQKAATIYLYGQLMEEAAQSARMKEYSRTIVRESESMISQISGFHSNDM